MVYKPYRLRDTVEDTNDN